MSLKARRLFRFAGPTAAAVAVAAVAAAPALGQDADVIGKTKQSPKPSCPKDPCQAVGSVTGFQVSAGGEKALSTVPRDGQLVAWSVHLSKPKSSQQKFFGRFYKDNNLGTVPAARIAVLKPEGKGNSFKLKAQSPVVQLSDELGSRPLYTLEDPIGLKKGDVLALTIPTWVSNFAVGLSSENVWRASRDNGECEAADDIKKGDPHQNVGSDRNYACTYRQARLLYQGFYVPA